MSTMKNAYSISYENNAVILTMTKSFAQKAGIYGSAEYRTLMGIRKDMPDIKIVVESKSKGGCASGMTYKNMKLVISQFEDSEQRMKEFDRIYALSKIHPSPYAYVKEWFKKNYAEFEVSADGKVSAKTKEEVAKAKEEAETTKANLELVKNEEDKAA